jgi:phosphatidate cytidylyltransferase
MRTRIITGLIITAALIGGCLTAPVWVIYAVLQLAALIGLLEILRMAAPRAPATDRFGALFAGVGLTVLGYAWPQALLGGVFLAPVVVLGSFLLRPLPIQTVAQRMSGALTAVFYVGLLFAALIALSTRAAGDDSPRALLLLGAIVFLGDTGAYFTGRFLGRHKLYPAVSPKKTIEGSLGGIGGSLLGALVFKVFLAPDLAWNDIVFVAIPCAVLGQVGDLTESLFKRSYGVKDSGSILPGHGGVLDRMDGILFAAPYMLLYHTAISPLALS